MEDGGEKMRKEYPSDISREQFEKIKPILESARKKTKPRKVELYDLFCAILYVVKSGCQWRMLPSDFPKWQNVYAHLKMWSQIKEGEESLLESVLKKNNYGRAYEKWKKQQNEFLHNRFSKR